MREAWIVDAVRSPIGRHGGALSGVRPDDLAAVVLKSILDRTGVPASEVEDVYMGCANQSGEDNRNVARMALPGGISAGGGGMHGEPPLRIRVGSGRGRGPCHSGRRRGHLHRRGRGVDVPGALGNPEGGGSFPAREYYGIRHLVGVAVHKSPAGRNGSHRIHGGDGGKLGRKYGIRGAPEDRFAFASQKKAVGAIDAGSFRSQIEPVPNGRGSWRPTKALAATRLSKNWRSSNRLFGKRGP